MRLLSPDVLTTRSSTQTQHLDGLPICLQTSEQHNNGVSPYYNFNGTGQHLLENDIRSNHNVGSPRDVYPQQHPARITIAQPMPWVEQQHCATTHPQRSKDTQNHHHVRIQDEKEPHGHGSGGNVVKFFCVDISQMSRCSQLLILTIGVFTLHIGAAAVQESIFLLPGFKPFGWYLVLLSFGVYGTYGLIEMQTRHYRIPKIPLKTHCQLAILTTISRGLPIAALGVLNYPTMLIFKCCKLVPVLLAGIVIQDKKVRLSDFLAASLMTVGLVFFSLADSQVLPNFNPKGYLYMVIAVSADALMSNIQEKALKSFQAAASCEVVACSYGTGCILVAIGLLFTSQLSEASKFCKSHLIRTYGYAVFYSTLGYFGIILCLMMVKTFSAFLTITVTTLRKVVTIVLSFLLFTKPFTFQYVWAGLLVLAGVSLSDFGSMLDLEERLQSWQRSIKRYILSGLRLDWFSAAQRLSSEIDNAVLINGSSVNRKLLMSSKSAPLSTSST